MKKILLFISSFLIFSFGILFFNSYFLGGVDENLNNYIEKNYIDYNSKYEGKKYDAVNNYTEKNDIIIKGLKSFYNIKIIYFPNSFSKDVVNYIKPFSFLLNSYYFNDKITDLKVKLYKKENDIRGRMEDKSIKLFGIKNMSESEFVSVGVHELAHYIDLYFLKKEVFKDLSTYFYDISWKSTTVIKGGLSQKDFVSGYSMTNKYEDFAESFLYFILHNNDFLQKAQNSTILQLKYDFFKKYLFREKEFILTDFSIDNDVKKYYRDITKINISLEKLLVFLEK